MCSRLPSRAYCVSVYCTWSSGKSHGLRHVRLDADAVVGQAVGNGLLEQRVEVREAGGHGVVVVDDQLGVGVGGPAQR